MKKVLKTVLKIFIGFVALLFIGAVAVVFYFKAHKKDLIYSAKQELQQKIKAQVLIKDAGINWFATFPYVSLEFDSIEVVDTVNNHDAIPFIKANELYLNCDLFQLLKGKVHINRMALNNGAVFFQRDSNGKSNLHILDAARSPEKKPEEADQTLFNYLTLNNIKVHISNAAEYKKFDVIINHMISITHDLDTTACYDIDMDMHLNYIGFNTRDGMYGQNKELKGVFRLYLNSKKQTLTLNHISLYLDHEKVEANGVFNLDTAKHFRLQLDAPSFSYKNASTALLEKTQPLLALFEVSKPMHFTVLMYGNTKFLSIPHVDLKWTIADNEILTPLGGFSKCSMSGTFINDVDQKKPRLDNNSELAISNFTGLWKGASPTQARSIVVSDFIHPFVHLEIQSQVHLDDIDSLINSNDFTLESGIAKINLVFDGPINDKDRVAPDLMGSIVLQNARMLYSPRNMRLKNCNAVLKFHHHSFAISSLSAKLGSSDINITGSVPNFSPVFTDSRNVMLLNCDFRSSSIDLNELIPLLTKRNQSHRSVKSKRQLLAGIGDAMDDFTNLCSVNAGFYIQKLNYKKFEANDLNASIQVSDQEGWKISSLSMKQGKGKIDISGSVTENNNDVHFVSISTTLTDIDVPSIFRAFDDFGMPSLHADNLKGEVDMDARLKLTINDQAVIMPGSLNGIMDFRLKNGGLLNFKPLQEIGKKIFPNRDYSDIEFATLKDKVTISNKVIEMDRMEIASTLMRIFVQGKYDLNNTGTDIVIQVPLKNISKRYDKEEPDNKGIHAKTGPSIYVHAVENDKKQIEFKYSLSDKIKGKHKKGEPADSSENKVSP